MAEEQAGQEVARKGIDWQTLAAPYPADEIEWRVQTAGKNGARVWAFVTPYVTNRGIQARLDDVVGPANWKNEFLPGPGGGVVCGLSIRVPREDGTYEWVQKWDGAENTDVEGVKGGLSGAMKRAAVQFGIGRYLYGAGDLKANVHPDGRLRGRLPGKHGGDEFRWNPPQLPAHLLPPRRSAERPPLAAVPASATGNQGSASQAAESRVPGNQGGEDDLEHDARLHFIRQVGGRVDDAAEIRINRKVRNLKDFVRENWSAIKEQPKVARAVVEAIESATGTAFDRERAA